MIYFYYCVLIPVRNCSGSNNIITLALLPFGISFFPLPVTAFVHTTCQYCYNFWIFLMSTQSKMSYAKWLPLWRCHPQLCGTEQKLLLKLHDEGQKMLMCYRSCRVGTCKEGRELLLPCQNSSAFHLGKEVVRLSPRGHRRLLSIF